MNPLESSNYKETATDFTVCHINKHLYEDALYEVFRHLNEKDLTLVASVCHKWKLVAGISSLWIRFAQEKFPHLQRISGMDGKEHYFRNFRGATFKRIQRNGSVIYSAWGKTIAAWPCSRLGQHGIWTMVPTRSSHTAAINAFDVRHVGLHTYMITGGGDNSLKVWKRAYQDLTFTLKQSYETHQQPITAIKGLHQYVLSGSLDGNLNLWTIIPNGLQQLTTTKAHGLGVSHLLAISSLALFVSSGRNKIKIWKVTGNELKKLQTLQIDAGQITALGTLLHDNSVLLFGGASTGALHVWQADQNNAFAAITTFQAHQGGIADLHISQNTGEIFSTGGDRTVKKWKCGGANTEWNCENIFQLHHNKIVTCVYASSVNHRFEVNSLIVITPDKLTVLGFHPQISRLHFRRLSVPVQEPDWSA